MGVLSGDDIKDAVKQGRLLIQPYHAENVGTASIDLTLGNEVRNWLHSAGGAS